mgnify:CR=1 FL=1
MKAGKGNKRVVWVWWFIIRVLEDENEEESERMVWAWWPFFFFLTKGAKCVFIFALENTGM